MPVVSTGQITITDVHDGLNLLLSNPAHVLPSNDQGAILPADYANCVCTAQVMKGPLNVTNDWNISITASTGIAGAYSNNTYSVTALTADSAYVDFIATRPGEPTLTQRFSVTRSKNAADGLTIIVSNESHVVASNSAGAVSSYAGSGTTVRVLEGASELNAASNNSANGSFTIGTPVVSPSGKITVGGRSYSSKTATIANHSAMAADTDSVTLTYPVNIRRSNGTTVSLNKIQTVTKSKQGGTGETGGRGTVHVYAATSGTVWNDSEANAALAVAPHNGKIVADRVTLYNSAAGWTQTRFWTGTVWEVLGEVIDGNLLVTGSVTARAININDLFAQRITLPDGGVIRAGTTTYAEMGGDGYFTAQADTETIFKIGKNNDHFINGQHISQTLPWQAFDGSVIPYIRQQLALGTPSAGGSASGSGALTSAGVTVTTTGSIPSAGASSAITVVTSYGGYSIRINGGEVGPQIPQVTVQLYRIVNDGTPVAIGALTTKSGNVLPAEPLGSGVYQWTVRVPGFSVSMSDASPGVGNIKYRAVVTIANPPTNQLGTVSLSANQAATGVVSGTVSWSSIPDKPNLSLVGHTHSAADITGVVATTGDQNIGGVKLFTGEVRSSSANTYRAVQGNYGVFFRNDGSNFYLMKTASGDPYGNWDSARPFMLNLATGIASINGNAATVTNGVYTVGNQTISGIKQFNNNLHAYGNVAIGSVHARNTLSIGTDNTGAVDRSLHFGYGPSDYYGFKMVHSGHASSVGAGTFKLQRGTAAQWVDVLTVDNGGAISINNAPLRLRGITDSYHYLAYVNIAAGGWQVDGPELVGNGGGRLGTADGNTALYWGKNRRVYLNEWLEFTNNGHIGLYWSSHGSQLQCEGGGRYTFQGGSDIGIHLSDGSGNKQGIIYASGRNIGFLIPDLAGWALRVDQGGNAHANDFIATSDRRIKSELEVIPNALDKVSKMTGYTYMKKGNDKRRQAGYIAQDLQAVLPEGVFEYDDVLQVSNSATIGLLLNAVNELSAEVKELKRRLH